jgi:hypothetical protein
MNRSYLRILEPVQIAGEQTRNPLSGFNEMKYSIRRCEPYLERQRGEKEKVWSLVYQKKLKIMNSVWH